MKVLVCGGRDYADGAAVDMWLGHMHGNRAFSLLIEGGARGADTLARQFAGRSGIPVQTFPADWKKHGKAAGAIRNRQMLAEGAPDLVVAFPGGRGTADMVRQARAAGLSVVEVVG